MITLSDKEIDNILNNTKRGSMKTHEEFEVDLYNLTNGKYDVMGLYKTNEVPIKFKHNTCGHVWNEAPKNVFSYIRNGIITCPICRVEMNRQKRANEYYKRLEEEFNGNYTASNYTKSIEPITIKHNVCGYEWEATAAKNFIESKMAENNMCPKCLKNGEEFYDEYHQRRANNYYNKLRNMFKGNYTASNYTKNREPITIKHNVCGYEWEASSAKNFIESKMVENNMCPKCLDKNKEVKKTIPMSYKQIEIETPVTLTSDIELTNNMVVELSNGNIYMVVGDSIMNFNDGIDLKAYDGEFKKDKNESIIKIFDPISSIGELERKTYDLNNLIWFRGKYKIFNRYSIPSVNESYYFINLKNLEIDEDIWKNDEKHLNRLSKNLVFKSRKDVEIVIEKIKNIINK